MPTIIKKGTNPSVFILRSGKKVVLEVGAGGGDLLNILPDAVYDELMREYGGFIVPRIISDKHPDGCFIIHDKREYAESQGREVGEVKDGSAPIDPEKTHTKTKRKKK